MPNVAKGIYRKRIYDEKPEFQSIFSEF